MSIKKNNFRENHNQGQIGCTKRGLSNPKKKSRSAPRLLSGPTSLWPIILGNFHVSWRQWRKPRSKSPMASSIPSQSTYKLHKSQLGCLESPQVWSKFGLMFWNKKKHPSNQSWLGVMTKIIPVRGVYRMSYSIGDSENYWVYHINPFFRGFS